MARNTYQKIKKVSSDHAFRKKKPLGYFPVDQKMEVSFQGGVGPANSAVGDAGSSSCPLRRIDCGNRVLSSNAMETSSKRIRR